MRRRNSRRHGLLAAAGVFAAGCALGQSLYSAPYALFEPERRSATEDTRPAFILKIDGRNVSIDRSDPVPPGKRVVDVSIPGPRAMSNPERATLTVDAKPCTRYYLAARRSSRTASDWSAFVAAAEPIGECVKKFPSAQ